jgi:FkbM family methyltransferase
MYVKWRERKSKQAAKIVLDILKYFGVGIIRSNLKDLLFSDPIFHSYARWTKKSKNEEFSNWVVSQIRNSYSQLQQDLVVLKLSELFESKGNFFVEFGATDGINLSNTYLLEKNGWNGILSEPAKFYQDALKRNRKCNIDYRCVYSISGAKMEFSESNIGEHSSLSGFSRRQGGLQDEEILSTYEVESISLIELLVEYHAPSYISYLSIDTEGSEYEILKNFDFSRYTFGFISVEVTQNHGEISGLLTQNGYVQILAEYSAWDQWWVPENGAVASYYS